MHKLFPADQVAVIGLHTVFEHHAVMGPEALEVFIEEYGWSFPIGVDAPATDGGAIPLTMQALQLRGTPSFVLIDREGRVRFQHFGAMDDTGAGSGDRPLARSAGLARQRTPPEERTAHMIPCAWSIGSKPPPIDKVALRLHQALQG